nr:MAG: hypothetical protein AM324_16275 [Candidatus Thorarchaeota archaeon SMTZ1-83]
MQSSLGEGSSGDDRDRTDIVLHAIMDSIKARNEPHAIQVEGQGHPRTTYGEKGCKVDHAI